MAIKVKVRSLWQGKVGIHSKYYERSIKENSPIEVIYENEYMEVRPDERPESRSKETFVDKFTKKSYYLVYYPWKPTVTQAKLI